jgi:hypothetical protein
MVKQYNFQNKGYSANVLEKSCFSDSNSKRIAKRLQNRLQGKNSNEDLILASTNIRSYKCGCCFEMPEVQNVALIFMGMIAMSFVNRIYHHQKLASGGKGTARLSN